MVTALVGGYEEVGDICFCRKKKQQQKKKNISCADLKKIKLANKTIYSMYNRAFRFMINGKKKVRIDKHIEVYF